MKIFARLALAVAALSSAAGCARSAKVSTVHLDQPGTHIVSGNGSVSIAQNQGNTSRVCTRVVGQAGKHGKRSAAPAPHAGGPAAHLDVLLFRLCEARGNGDIGAEQYAASVQSIVKLMETMANRPPPMTPRMQPRAPFQRTPRMRPGRFGRPGDGPAAPRDRDDDDDDREP